MPISEAKTLAITDVGRILPPGEYENLVLYVHLSQNSTESWDDYSFNTAVYEADTQELSGNEIPILFCNGEGYENWERALTCISVLFYGYPKTRLVEVLGEWFLLSKTSQTAAHTLSMQIRKQGTWTTLVLPILRVIFPESENPVTTSRYPTDLVYTFNTQTNTYRRKVKPWNEE